MYIQKILAYQILDSRGMPTISTIIQVSSGEVFKAYIPAGASKGRYEAVELRDNKTDFFLGKGVLSAVDYINTSVAHYLQGKKIEALLIDKLLIEMNMPANCSLGISMAIWRAQSFFEKIPLYVLLQKHISCKGLKIPKNMFNIVNGGAHVSRGLFVQEFMIIPQQENLIDVLNCAVKCFYALKNYLLNNNISFIPGDEGGFGIQLKTGSLHDVYDVLDSISKAIKYAGYNPGVDVLFSLDVAASQFYDKKTNQYKIYDTCLTVEQMVDWYSDLIEQYSIYSLEDVFDQDDVAAWAMVTEKIGNRVLLVGDDLFVTNSERIYQGVANRLANSVLIKPNQNGTIGGTIQAINTALNNNYNIIVSHRSGETEDAFIADLAYAVGKGFKAGPPVHSERVAKYNRLLAIDKGLE